MSHDAFTILVGLCAASGLGPKTIRVLRERFEGEVGLVEAARAGDRTIPARVTEAVVGARERGLRVLEDCARLDIQILVRGEGEWPDALECLDDVPEILFSRGRPEVLRENAVGIVGARECSAEGHDFTLRLAGRLAEEGWVTVSGLARGIDGAAHRGCLAAGGETVAVLGCGLDIAYPEEHRALQSEIAETGVLLSEFAPGMPPVPGNFPRRNRILAALARAIVLVECRTRSGALVTCRHAFEHGKDVYVVPGWPTSPLSAGPLQFLRDGARVIRGAEDLLEDLAGIPGGPRVAACEVEDAESNDPARLRELGARLELLGEASPGRLTPGL